MSKQHTKHALQVVLALIVSALLLGCSSSSAEQGDPEDVGLLELETFLTNIRDLSGQRYCKLTVKLAVAPGGKVAEIEEDPLALGRVRDEVLTLLSAKTFHELSEPEGREALREDIRVGVTEILKNGEIREVLFSEFVVQ